MSELDNVLQQVAQSFTTLAQNIRQTQTNKDQENIFTAKQVFGSVGKAAIKLNDSTPTAPENGDIWHHSNTLYVRLAATTRTLIHNGNPTSLASDMSQAEAETGVSTTRRWLTAQRVRQAAVATIAADTSLIRTTNTINDLLTNLSDPAGIPLHHKERGKFYLVPYLPFPNFQKPVIEFVGDFKAMELIGNGFEITNINSRNFYWFTFNTNPSTDPDSVSNPINDGKFYIGTANPSRASRLNYNGSLHATNFFGNGNGITWNTDITNGKFYTGTTNPTGTTRLNYAGNFHATNIFAGSTQLTSDMRLKHRITDIDIDESKLLELDAFAYVTKESEDQDPSELIIDDNTIQYGFSAQQLQTLLPHLVTETESDNMTDGKLLTVEMLGLIAPIVKLLQSQEQRIKDLEALVQQLLNN